jgi:hypothetical protein
VINGIETPVLLRLPFIFINLQMARALLFFLIARGGTVRSSKPCAIRLSSKSCATCEDLRRLKARSDTALRNARNLYRAADKTTNAAALQNLEEELKQTSAARKLICYAIHAHLTNQHSGGVRLAA